MRRFPPYGQKQPPPRPSDADIHGLISPEGVELTNRPEDVQAQGGAERGQRGNLQRRPTKPMVALADTATPTPDIQLITASTTASTTPSPPNPPGRGRPSPPDASSSYFASQFDQGPSPAIEVELEGSMSQSQRLQRRQLTVSFDDENTRTRLFESPSPGVSERSRSTSFATPSPSVSDPPSVRREHPTWNSSIVTPMQHGGQSPARFDPVRMGTPRSASAMSPDRTIFGTPSRRPEVFKTPLAPDGYDSTSDSESSVTEGLTTHIQSLDNLLLSTGKQLGKLGSTSFSPEKNINDSLDREERELEEARRQLRRELAEVDFEVFEETPLANRNPNLIFSPFSPDQVVVEEPSTMQSSSSTPSRRSRDSPLYTDSPGHPSTPGHSSVGLNTPSRFSYLSPMTSPWRRQSQDPPHGLTPPSTGLPRETTPSRESSSISKSSSSSKSSRSSGSSSRLSLTLYSRSKKVHPLDAQEEIAQINTLEILSEVQSPGSAQFSLSEYGNPMDKVGNAQKNQTLGSDNENASSGSHIEDKKVLITEKGTPQSKTRRFLDRLVGGFSGHETPGPQALDKRLSTKSDAQQKYSSDVTTFAASDGSMILASDDIFPSPSSKALADDISMSASHPEDESSLSFSAEQNKEIPEYMISTPVPSDEEESIIMTPRQLKAPEPPQASFISPEEEKSGDKKKSYPSPSQRSPSLSRFLFNRSFTSPMRSSRMEKDISNVSSDASEKESSQKVLLPKNVKRSDTGSISTTAKVRSPLEVKSSAYDETHIVEEENMPHDVLEQDKKEELRHEMKDQETNWLLRTIGSFGSPYRHQALSPIAHDEEDSVHKTEIEVVFERSPPKILFEDYSSSDDEEQPNRDASKQILTYSIEESDESKELRQKSIKNLKAKEKSYRRFVLNCIVIGLIFVAGLILGIFLDRNTEGDEAIPTSSPSQQVPTTEPTDNTISFETVYDIAIRDGLVDNVPREEYEADLNESMDRLLDILITNLPDDFPGSRRRLVSGARPSTINKIETIECPQTRPQTDKCEEVFAWITLEDADDTWDDLKILLEIAIDIGRLQRQLDEVNPLSRVEILRRIFGPIPTEPPAPAPTPTISPAPTSTDLFEFLLFRSFDNGDALRNENSAQYAAYVWLSQDENLPNYEQEKILQRYVMATLYYSTDGDNWFFNDMWLSAEDECVWYSKNPSGACNDQGQVKYVDLDFNNLNGSLPPELGLLSSSLEEIVIRGGPTTVSRGTIPSEYGFLTKLTLFIVRNNAFDGTLSSTFGNWHKLEQLDVAENSFSGSIPTELGQLTELTSIDLGANQISGTIPTQLGNLRKCQRMTLQSNTLAGSIPSELSELRRLRSFDARFNELEAIPRDLGRLPFLESLLLSENEIQGTIPTELGGLLRLRQLDLSKNQFEGTIPSQLGLLWNMRDLLDVSFNRLEGSVPLELGRLDRLRVLKLNANKLSGSLPAELSGLERVTTIQIDANDLTGEIPIEMCLVFNETLPAFQSDCSEFEDNCPCCITCCVDDEGCECRYLGTPDEFLCFQQR